MSAANALDDTAVPTDGMGSDIHAAPDYRAYLLGVLMRRAVNAIAIGQ